MNVATAEISTDEDHPDKPSYEVYAGQNVHEAFPSDVPAPPILVPVPGAGPLGPFVPAPPEVAMRRMRDGGGPSSFETNGGPRGRKGRLGLSPILPMPPQFRPDPRRLRSYRDLDAQEDEVTIIDYRSL